MNATTTRPASFVELQTQARALCEAQPGYGTPAYRGDPADALALQQQTERMLQDMAGRIVAEDLRYCVSGVVSVLLRGATDADGDSIVSDEDGYTLSYRQPDADDYRDAVPHGERVTVMQRQEDGQPGSGLWEWFGPNSDSVFTDEGADYPETELEAWESAFEANGWDRPDGSEIFEHWLVSSYLAGRLRAAGESVVDDVHGLTVWGRATTGQAIAMDSVIRDIARGVLEA